MAAGVTPGRPAAAASAVMGTIRGPEQQGVVLGVLREALIIGLDTPAGPRVLSVLSSAASGVPNGVRLGGELAPGIQRSGDSVSVGHGGISMKGLTVTVVRTWDSAVHRIDPARKGRTEGIGELAEAASAVDRGVPPTAIDALEDAMSDGSSETAMDSAVGALVGLGRGLTPGGDDVLAGLLTGLHATGLTDVAARVGRRAMTGVTSRTTQLTVELLRLAAAGHACQEALAFLNALHAGGPTTSAIHRLLSIGHTSGADLATGLCIGLRVGAARQEVR